MSMKLFYINFVFTALLACDNIPANLLTSCSFNYLAVVNPSTGFVITDENCGIEIDKKTFFEQPFVFYSEALDLMEYTLIMIDHSNSLIDRNFLHWMVINIDGQSLKHGLGINAGNTLAGKILLN